jgi:hypothetical protein
MGGGSHREAQYIKLPIVDVLKAPAFEIGMRVRSAAALISLLGVVMLLCMPQICIILLHTFKILAESGGGMWRIATLLL